MMQIRTAFTLIELVFVIIILAALSVVALPKFLSLSNEAQVAKCTSAIGTMNRTVGLNFWSASLSAGKEGNVTSYITTVNMKKNLPDYNSTDCGALIGLVAGAPVAGDGTYGSPRLLNDGNMSHAPKWEWVKK